MPVCAHENYSTSNNQVWLTTIRFLLILLHCGKLSIPFQMVLRISFHSSCLSISKFSPFAAHFTCRILHETGKGWQLQNEMEDTKPWKLTTFCFTLKFTVWFPVTHGFLWTACSNQEHTNFRCLAISSWMQVIWLKDNQCSTSITSLD
jgi:hypothetical protein